MEPYRYGEEMSFYQNTNLASLLTGAEVELIQFTETLNVRHSSWPAEKPSYLVYSQVYHAPIIINFACIKRHYLANMCTALKNNVGCVASSNAEESHRNLHRLSGNSFLQEIPEIAGLINPELMVERMFINSGQDGIYS